MPNFNSTHVRFLLLSFLYTSSLNCFLLHMCEQLGAEQRRFPAPVCNYCPLFGPDQINSVAGSFLSATTAHPSHSLPHFPHITGETRVVSSSPPAHLLTNISARWSETVSPHRGPLMTNQNTNDNNDDNNDNTHEIGRAHV